jgi:hypothetical protein
MFYVCCFCANIHLYVSKNNENYMYIYYYISDVFIVCIAFIFYIVFIFFHICSSFEARLETGGKRKQPDTMARRAQI